MAWPARPRVVPQQPVDQTLGVVLGARALGHRGAAGIDPHTQPGRGTHRGGQDRPLGARR